MSSGLMFTVETGGKTVKSRNPRYAVDTYKKAIAQQTCFVYFDKLKYLGSNVLSNFIYIIAIFIQRLASRTPMDENYTYKQKVFEKAVFVGKKRGRNIWMRTGSEQTFHHHKDKNFARYDWELSCEGTTITTKQIADECGKEVFYTENDSESIKKIYSVLKSTFSEKTIEQMNNLKIENHNKHIDVLEYGMYKKDSAVIKQGKWEHGVKNHYSVQAPKGMLRQTMLELRAIADTQTKSMKSNSMARYKRQTTTKTLSDARIKQLINKTDFTNMEASLQGSIDEIFKTLKVGEI